MYSIEAPFPPMLVSLEVLQVSILIYTHRQMSVQPPQKAAC